MTMWDFCKYVFDQKDGGFGLLLALAMVCGAFSTGCELIARAIRRKG